jgi:predicted RNA-binding Zn-ribbon protein involved in translation (DUF1610 family)
VGQSVELIPLVCTHCSTPLPANPEEVAWVCAQCGQGLLLDEQKGLAPLDVYYSARIPPNTRGKPYWVAMGDVTVQRKTYDSGQRGDQEAQQFWSRPRQFIIPAYDCTLDAFTKTGVDWLGQPPALQPGPPAAFEPVTLHLDDVQAAAEFIVVAVEAGRSDKMKEVSFSLDLSTPALWILPG